MEITRNYREVSTGKRLPIRTLLLMNFWASFFLRDNISVQCSKNFAGLGEDLQLETCINYSKHVEKLTLLILYHTVFPAFRLKMSGYGRSNEVWQYRDTYWHKSAWLKGFTTHERWSQLDKLRVFPATLVISTWLIYAANSNPFHQKTFTQTLCTSMWKYKETQGITRL